MDAYIHEVTVIDGTLVITFSGCDYRCRYCDVPHLVEFRTGEVKETKEVAAFIASTGATKALFTGGEPLLQKRPLLELLRTCRQRGLRTAVDTNAGKPDVITALLDERLVDEFIVDIKAPASGFDRVTRSGTFFAPVTQRHEEFLTSLRILNERQDEALLSFKTLITPGLIYKKEDILAIAATLEGFDAEWVLAPFNPTRTLDPSLQGVAPPTRKFLETLACFVRKAHPSVRVRVGEAAH